MSVLRLRLSLGLGRRFPATDQVGYVLAHDCNVSFHTSHALAEVHNVFTQPADFRAHFVAQAADFRTHAADFRVHFVAQAADLRAHATYFRVHFVTQASDFHAHISKLGLNHGIRADLTDHQCRTDCQDSYQFLAQGRFRCRLWSGAVLGLLHF